MRSFILILSMINMMFLSGCSKKDIPKSNDIIFKCEGERGFTDFNQRKKAELKPDDAISDYHIIDELLVLYANRSYEWSFIVNRSAEHGLMVIKSGKKYSYTGVLAEDVFGNVVNSIRRFDFKKENGVLVFRYDPLQSARFNPKSVDILLEHLWNTHIKEDTLIE